MKILVIGATGLLGSAILKENKSKKISIKGTSREKKKNLINLDLTNTSQAREVLKKFDPDVIVNCCALTNVDECNKSYKSAILHNSTTVKKIVNLAISLKKRPHIIHISTDQVYNNQNIIKKNFEK